MKKTCAKTPEAPEVKINGALIKIEEWMKKTYVQQLIREQRRLGLGICRGNRTVATDVVLVISRTIPIDLLVQEMNGSEKGTAVRNRK
ncbi:UNVERIFIED_CONTAM: hypothetical protein PYX00_003606 [Menopon gallinae]|uniref:Uncharacterized protein n=1 Tax=Menopon gallinae TaxID=328185 RepID=A0AAW2I0Z0_9NEOP